VANARYVGTAAAIVIGIVSKLPILGWLAGIVVNIGLSAFQAPDGSIDFYVPGTTSVNGYGSSYYYNGPYAGWYYHNPSFSSWYGYARRESNGVYYYERLTSY